MTEQYKLKKVIFDFDGTIADSYSYYLRILDEMYPHFNIGLQTPEELELQRTKSFKTIIKENNIPLLQVLIAWRKVTSRFGKEVDQIRLFPGIKEMLEKLNKANIKLAVVSMNKRQNIEDFLEQNDLLRFVSDIQTSNVILGKQATLKKIVKSSKLNVKETLYVGDEARDILVCKKVGMPIAAVTWGFNSEEGLKPHNPEYLVNNTNELFEIIKTLSEI